MSKRTKKALIFTGIGLDVALTVALFVIAIIMLVTLPELSRSQFGTEEQYRDYVFHECGPFIGTLQLNHWLYFGVGVVPLFVLLGVNIAGLTIYVKKAGKAKATLDELSAEQKAALKAELLKEMQEEPKE